MQGAGLLCHAKQNKSVIALLQKCLSHLEASYLIKYINPGMVLEKYA